MYFYILKHNLWLQQHFPSQRYQIIKIYISDLTAIVEPDPCCRVTKEPPFSPLQPLDHCMLPSISVTTTGAAQAEIYWSSAAQNNIIMKSQYRIFCKPHSYTDTVNINCTNSANIITYNKAYDGIHLPYQLSESKKGLTVNLLFKAKLYG